MRCNQIAFLTKLNPMCSLPLRSSRRCSGMVLLVVLGMLTFFSILAASYLVFSNQSRQSAYVIASRSVRAPAPNDLIDQALMKLIVGTDDINDSFFGEDLLSDYYGRFDAIDAQALHGVGPASPGNGVGYITINIVSPGGLEYREDILAGRIVTFTENTSTALSLRSVRVIRSFVTSPTPSQYHHVLVFALPADLVLHTPAQIDNAIASAGASLRINGSPRNHVGFGVDIATRQTLRFTPPSGWGYELPRSLQPNKYGNTSGKNSDTANGLHGDFDESYDGADFQNWFLSYRDTSSGALAVTPSFHRPAVLNYILNELPLPTDPDDFSYLVPVQVRRNIIANLARGTFRPLPIGSATGIPYSQHERFVGSSNNYGLRTPINLTGDGSTTRFRLDQLAKALIGTHVAGASAEDRNPWDVDNDKDGVPDSVWIDMGLPAIHSQEGKMLRPLVALMIEDLSARLNVNAHGNSELEHDRVDGGISREATWANTDKVYREGTVFRGFGYGPAEITIPPWLGAGTAITDRLLEIRSMRYRQPGQLLSSNAPGREGADALMLFAHGYRPSQHSIFGGYGYTIDPFGRAAVGIGRGGHLIAAVTPIQPGAIISENVDTPYDIDPTGSLAGDSVFTFDELEPLLRSGTFDIDLLPQRLHGRLMDIASGSRRIDYEHAFTTASVSDDSLALPPTNNVNLREYTALRAIRELFESAMEPPGSLNDTVLRTLVAPEFRLGRKLDVNRPIGNGVDDDTNVAAPGYGVIDEPSETSDSAFPVHSSVSTSVPPPHENHNSTVTNYRLGDPSVDPQQLLAKHLYVLMMALTHDATLPHFSDGDFRDGEPDDSTELQQYRARRIAQWAVNVVDYRDADSIMTRFVYDPAPFNGAEWQPDPTCVVWGVEQPELLFSESHAMHDVRVRDTNRDTSGQSKADGDTNTDQVRIPQGSLFLELYNARVTSRNAAATDQDDKQGAPRELYTLVGGEAALDLGKFAPLTPGSTLSDGVPVWRIAVSTPHTDRGIGVSQSLSPLARRTSHPNTMSFEPKNLEELPSADPVESLPIRRYIMFSRFGHDPGQRTALNSRLSPLASETLSAGSLQMDADTTFFSPLAVNSDNPLLYPGQYLTLAPRVVTQFGSNYFTGNVPEQPSTERLRVVPGQGLVYHNRTNATANPDTPALGLGTGNAFGNAMPLIIGTFRRSGWDPNVFADGFVGLNVSEPMPYDSSYYTEPQHLYGGTSNSNYLLRDAYVDMTGANNTALAGPLDVETGLIPTVSGATGPGEFPALGGVRNYCTVFLQRLADPTMPFHDTDNPYRTVDWMSVDLNVFSGEEVENTVTEQASGGQYMTWTRQRNGIGSGSLNQTPTRDVLYSYETNEPDATQLDSNMNPAEPFFKLQFPGGSHLRNSFSMPNTVIPRRLGGAFVELNPAFDGFTRSIGLEWVGNGRDLNGFGFDRNLPLVPFAQHPWLNRPFASPMELMMVPASSQSRLFEEFSIPSSPSSTPVVYSHPTQDPDLKSAESLRRYHGPFRHLLNFFSGDRRNLPSTVTDSQRMSFTEFSRLFDYVHTLPRFRGEIEPLVPSQAASLTVSPTGDNLHHPPFNFLYDNRRQGRVNLNTVADFPVWVGLMQGHLFSPEVQDRTSSFDLAFDRFLAKRRGYDVSGETYKTLFDYPNQTVNYDPSRFHPDHPSDLVGAYRNHLSAAFGVPFRQRSPAPPTLQTASSVSADASFLRRNDWLAHPTGQENALLVRRSGLDGTEPPVPIAFQEPTGATDNYSISRFRNAFTRYQTVMRMPNLASDNSQLYLVRMTVGLFETNPEGSLGREYNEDMGQNQRFEAMFIIDRSIPVGFVPGNELNSRNVVVFEKYYQ